MGRRCERVIGFSCGRGKGRESFQRNTRAEVGNTWANGPTSPVGGVTLQRRLP